MSNESRDERTAGSELDASEFKWKGVQALRRVHDLNERCIELLTQLARTERGQIHLAIVSQHRPLWRTLSPTARRRAALAPYLLLDVHFQDAEWWRWARGARGGARRGIVAPPAFSGKVAAELMRETIMLAWSTAAFGRGAASVVLGMAPPVCDIIAELGPQDAERVAARHSRHLRPRWEDFPAFWGSLLSVAQQGDEHALHEVRLHGLQLLGSELLPRLDGRLGSFASTRLESRKS